MDVRAEAIARVGARDGGPLDRVAAADQEARDLQAVAESVVEHFVAEARRAGCSWSQIGRALEMSKQAAHQRFAIGSVLRDRAGGDALRRRAAGRAQWMG